MEELVKCKNCGKEFMADSEELASYFCKCKQKPIDKKELDKFIKMLGEKFNGTSVSRKSPSKN
jgi:arsenate reductase-like glutaredoxin family protein